MPEPYPTLKRLEEEHCLVWEGEKLTSVPSLKALSKPT
jgi:hypothetical protein